jgi:hypothetical protein
LLKRAVNCAKCLVGRGFSRDIQAAGKRGL